MILFHSKVWPAFKFVLTRWGPFKKVDVLTGFLGSGASKVVKKFGNARVRIVFGLNSKNPALSTSQIQELKALEKVAKLKVSSGLHAKQYLFDDRFLLLGSANFTRSGFERLQEVLIVTDDRGVLGGARGLFDGIWKKAKPLPKRIREISGSSQNGKEAEGVHGIGLVSSPGQSPFSTKVAGRKVKKPERTTKTGTLRDARLRVRICAYNPKWLLTKHSFNDSKTVDWTTGRGIRPGDLQVFCVSANLKDEPQLAADPSVDAVHSIWKAATGYKPELGNLEWPIQARFKLLVRLDNPVPKMELVKAKILVVPRWPQGSAGKILRKEDDVRRLADVLSQRNPRQRKIIFSAFE